MFNLVAILIACAAPSQDKHFVELEIIINERFGIDQGQEWIEVLSEVGADNVRLRRGSTSTRPSVKKIENALGATYKIIGVATTRGLKLPGGTFSMRDKAGLRELIQKIRDDGAEVALAEKMAFGLTAEQLVELHTDLAKPYEQSTTGKSPGQVLEDIRLRTKTPILVDAKARQELNDDYVLQDELQGLTHGTVLAAALRPIGLVVAPRRLQGKSTEIVITDSRLVQEHWPIGWPLQDRPSKAIPNLFERIPTQVQTNLKSALEAIASRLEVPFLYDRNSMARQGIVLDKVRVNMTAEEASYNSILQRILAQAKPKLQMELRADESGSAFVWVSPRSKR